jgi:hypothetical protein
MILDFQQPMDRITSNVLPLYPWFNPPGPAPALESQQRAALTPGPRWSCWVGHTHLWRPQPNPGADAFAFQALGLVEFSPIGAATINRDQLDHYQPGTLFADLGLVTSGLGGLAQGQYITAPLIVAGELQMDVGGDETAYATG